MQIKKDIFPPGDPQAVQGLLEQADLGQLVRKAQQIIELQSVLDKVLPREFRAHCQVLNLRDGVLVLALDSAAWATQLRFQQQAILDAIRQVPVFRFIREIDCRIRPG